MFDQSVSNVEAANGELFSLIKLRVGGKEGLDEHLQHEEPCCKHHTTVQAPSSCSELLALRVNNF